MIVFFYEKVRLKRGAWQTVSIVLLIAFLCAFFTLFDGFICQKEQDMESAYAVIPRNCRRIQSYRHENR